MGWQNHCIRGYCGKWQMRMAYVQRNSDLHGNAPDQSRAALLLVDVLNDLKFPGGRTLLRNAPRLADNIAALKRRCREANIPAIYVNDNRDRWRSDYSAVVRQCLRPESPGRELVAALVPEKEDYIVLKPKHSAFYSTPLDTLLSYLGTQMIVLVGVTTEACILTTACEIHVRDMELFVPSDCVASKDPKQHRMALELMKKSYDAHTTTSTRLNLKKLLNR